MLLMLQNFFEPSKMLNIYAEEISHHHRLKKCMNTNRLVVVKLLSYLCTLYYCLLRKTKYDGSAVCLPTYCSHLLKNITENSFIHPSFQATTPIIFNFVERKRQLKYHHTHTQRRTQCSNNGRMGSIIHKMFMSNVEQL